MEIDGTTALGGEPTFEPLGDQALLLRWGDAIDVAVNRRVHAVAARLRASGAAWLVDCVPAYSSLAVFFDAASIGGNDPMDVVVAHVRGMIGELRGDADSTSSRLVEIPVCYDATRGPDLSDVAAACNLDEAQLIARHTQPEYVVAMLGFSPGFPYLLGLDPALAVPRLATPRVRVPAGSVGIGGAQTGIYPDVGPGGWRLIGRTPIALFDADRGEPSALLPGDRVRLVPIDAARFDELDAR